MSKGAKTWVFWLGLIVFALACMEVFSVVWFLTVTHRPYLNVWGLVEILTPFIVGGVVFIIVGLYMMKSGIKTQTRTSSEESEKEPTATVDSPLFATRTSALLDFYSDRAVAHASFVVASVFGLVTLLAIIQQLGDKKMVWLSVLPFTTFSYLGYFALIRFKYYADISERITVGLKRDEILKNIVFPNETLEEYMKGQNRSQRAILLTKGIPDKYTRSIFALAYWVTIALLGSIAYSKFLESPQDWLAWGGALVILTVPFVIIIPALLVKKTKFTFSKK